MSTGHSAHAWNIGNRGVCSWTGSQVDDPLAVWSGASYALRAALANEEAVAGAPNILPTRRRVADWSRLIARGALHNVLILFTGDVNHILANST